MVVTALVAVTGFASVVVLARNVPITLFGAVGLAVLAMNSIAAFDGLRPVVIVRMGGDEARGQSLFWPSLIYSALIGIVVGLGGGVLGYFSFGFGAFAAALLGLACFSHFIASALASFLDAFGHTAYTGVSRSLGWCLVYVVYMGLAIDGAALPAYAATLVMFQLMLLALYAFRLVKRWHIPRLHDHLRSEDIRDIAGESFNMIGFNLAALVLSITDRIVINTFFGTATYGLYSGAYDIAIRPTVLFRVVATVSLPEMVERGPHSLIGNWWTSMIVFFWLTTIAAGLAANFSAHLLSYALGAHFLAAETSFTILAGTLPLFAISYFGAVLCQAVGRFRLQRQIFTIGACAFLVLLPVLVYFFGVAGAAAAVFISRAVDPILVGALLRDLGVRPPYRAGAIALLCYAGMVSFAVAGWHLLSLVSWLGLSLATLALLRHMPTIQGNIAEEALNR